MYQATGDLICDKGAKAPRETFANSCPPGKTMNPHGRCVPTAKYNRFHPNGNMVAIASDR